MAELDPGSDTQSMLLDDSIKDEQLAQALAREHAGEFHWLAVNLLSMGAPSLPEPAAPGWRIVVEVLAQVVVERDRIWEQPSLRAWLARLTLRRCQRMEWRARFHLVALRLSSSLPFPVSEAFPPAFQTAWDKMGRYERLAILFHHVLGLSLAEIAWVLESEPYPVEYWVRESWRKISYETRNGNMPAAGEGEAGLAAAVSRLFPVRSLGQEELRFLHAEIAGRVQAARGKRRAAISARETILAGLVLGALFLACRAAGLLPEEIIHRYKTPTPTTEIAGSRSLPTPQAPFYFYYFPIKGETLEILAQRLGTTVESIISLNSSRFPRGKIFDLQPGDRILLPASPAMDWRATPIPVAPAPPPSPLTDRSALGAILQRMENHRLTWRTLWATVRETYYGPAGYLGPPLAQNLRQIWLSQPGRALVVFQNQNDPPDYSRLLFLNGFNFWGFDESSPEISGDYIGEVDEIPLYYTGRPASWMLYSPYYHPLEAIGSDSLQESSLRIVQEETFSGRQTVVLEGVVRYGTRRVRLWVDAQTGVILRRLDYSAESPEVVYREAGVTAVVFDVDFPAEIFNPRMATIEGFVQDPSGTPISALRYFLYTTPRRPEITRIPLLTVPGLPGFDASRQPVILQWPERWEQAVKTPTPGNPRTTPSAGGSPTPTGSTSPRPGVTASPASEPRIQVYAAQFYQGSLPLEKVNFGGCRRSPDGRLIALQDTGDPDKGIPGGIYWFNLEAPQEVHQICKDCYERPFAFSPDSLRLAFAGCRELSSPTGCSITVHDLPTGSQVTWQISNDIGEAYPIYLAWSPDARFLAILALVEGWSQVGVKILDLQTGKITYSGAYDPASGAVSLDSPTREWGLTLPPYDEIEMGCMEP